MLTGSIRPRTTRMYIAISLHELSSRRVHGSAESGLAAEPSGRRISSVPGARTAPDPALGVGSARPGEGNQHEHEHDHRGNAVGNVQDVQYSVHGHGCSLV